MGKEIKRFLVLCAIVNMISANLFAESVTFGKDNIRGFIFDNVFHSDSEGDIHFGLYVPKDYDGKEAYALFITLPGYEGLHFQGVGRNIKAEDYGVEAQKYNAKMIVVAPQLSDWRMTSAKQTVALTKYFLEHYNIDQTKVYLNGYSGGGETGSLVMQIAPELYTAFLHCSSQWDGELDPLVRARTPVYLVTGRNDTYYGSSSVQKTYRELMELYKKEGLSEGEIGRLVTMDLKDQSYFDTRGIKDQHGGGGLFAHDEAIMGWLFGEHEAIMNNQTGFTLSVPSEYTRQASQKGSVTRLDYTSKDYAGNGKAITKTAYVYTPYGYNEKGSERYDILYLMHGWGGHAGEYFEMAEIKNVFDNMISKGQIKPLIVVSATFYNANSGSDFGSSVAELRSFHNDFEKHLMPAVEGKYRTYAVSTSDADLKASRSHRAFGGFSLGSVTTWLEFCHDSDYISSFIPMSGSSWYYGGFGDFQIKKNVDFIEQLVIQKKLNERGYFIYHAVGTNDAVKEQSYMMAEEMLSRKTFSSEHYVFYQKQDGIHDHFAVREFLYNALPLIFGK